MWKVLKKRGEHLVIWREIGPEGKARYATTFSPDDCIKEPCGPGFISEEAALEVLHENLHSALMESMKGYSPSKTSAAKAAGF